MTLATWTVKKGKRIPRKRDRDFEPDSIFIEKAIDDFLKNGGKITKIEDLKDYDPFVFTFDLREVDEFLRG